MMPKSRRSPSVIGIDSAPQLTPPSNAVTAPSTISSAPSSCAGGMRVASPARALCENSCSATTASSVSRSSTMKRSCTNSSVTSMSRMPPRMASRVTVSPSARPTFITSSCRVSDFSSTGSVLSMIAATATRYLPPSAGSDSAASSDAPPPRVTTAPVAPQPPSSRTTAAVAAARAITAASELGRGDVLDGGLDAVADRGLHRRMAVRAQANRQGAGVEQDADAVAARGALDRGRVDHAPGPGVHDAQVDRHAGLVARHEDRRAALALGLELDHRAADQQLGAFELALGRGGFLLEARSEERR